MEYQKIINLLDDLTNQPSKFRAKNWVEINDKSRRDYNDDDENKNDNNNDNNIKFERSMIRSSLCDYSDEYVLAKETATVPNTAAESVAVNNANIKYCIMERNNPQVDCTEDIDIVMPMYNLIEYSNAYLKILGCLWQCFRDKPAIQTDGIIIDIPANNNNNNSFKFK